MKEIRQKLVERADARVEQTQPCHCADIRGNHISHNEERAEKLLEIQVGASDEPCERKRDEHAENERRACRDEGVFEGGPVQLIGVNTLERLKGEAPGGKERSENEIEQRKNLKYNEKCDNGENEKPFEIKIKFSAVEWGRVHETRSFSVILYSVRCQKEPFKH